MFNFYTYYTLSLEIFFPFWLSFIIQSTLNPINYIQCKTFIDFNMI